MRNIAAASLIFLPASASLPANAAASDNEDFGHSAAIGVNFPGANFYFR